MAPDRAGAEGGLDLVVLEPELVATSSGSRTTRSSPPSAPARSGAMEETPQAAPVFPVALRTELVAEKVDGGAVVGHVRCTFRNRTSTEPLGRGAARDAYHGLLNEGSVSGVLLLRLDRFGASRVHWELRARAGGRVEWIHDEHGAEPRSWSGEAEFVDFWAELSEQATRDCTAQLLGLPGAGSACGDGLAISGQFALGLLRRLAVRRRRQKLEASEPREVAVATAGPAGAQFVPGQLKLILPPAAPFAGGADSGLDLDSQVKLTLPPMLPSACNEPIQQEMQKADFHQPSFKVKLILPPMPPSACDEQIQQEMQKMDFHQPSFKVLLPPCLPSQEVEQFEAWHSRKPSLEESGLRRIALFA
uniref:Uncharacterized protein n=1 Tax=Alexandrium monilatum TaxID=311494 RepID=A0A7S4PRY2_9DINO